MVKSTERWSINTVRMRVTLEQSQAQSESDASASRCLLIRAQDGSGTVRVGPDEAELLMWALRKIAPQSA